MKLSGAYTFSAPAEKVWAALTDPKALSNCIPGCQSMEATGDNQYKAIVTFALGPISGRYNATISMSEMSPHQSFRLSIQANGPVGFADGHADIVLDETGGETLVTVEADSQVGGAAARVGQRLMGTVAKTTMDRFFKCVEGQVAELLE